MKSVLLFLMLFLPASAVWAQAPAQWRLTSDLRIGSLDDADQSLTAIGGVSIGPDGLIFISQPRDRNVRVHDAAGRLVRTIGRRGGGPGEFQSISAMHWRSDTLYVIDNTPRRVTMFSADGELLSTLTVAVAGQPPFSNGRIDRMLDDGSMLVRAGVPSAAVADGTITAAPTLRVDRIASVLDTVLWMARGQSQFSIRFGGSQLFSAQPFPDGAMSATGADRIVVVDRAVATERREGMFWLHWVALSGDTVRSRSYRYTPKPLERARADSFIAERVEGYTDFAQRAGASRSDLEKALRGVVKVPEFLPPITNVVLSESGDAWLRREDLPGDSVQWNVLSPAGDVLAVFPLPKRVRPLRIEGDVLYSAETDEFDVPYLVRYRIARR